jgi:SAM-dependent methyltransferase
MPGPCARQDRTTAATPANGEAEVVSEAVFSAKAEIYAKFRWDYAPAAIEAAFQIAGLCLHSVLADLGAGTGILTRHLCGRVRQVFAIEPNPQMRAILDRDCAWLPGCCVLDSTAEATGLPDTCLDAALAAQAIHWFEPQATRRELRRILKPAGWLALLDNRVTDPELNIALRANDLAEGQSAQPAPGAHIAPEAYYFAPGAYQTLLFPFTIDQDGEAFLGAQLSASYAPDPGQPRFPNFTTAAQGIFERFSRDGRLRVTGETRLMIGRLRGE